jgi:hypothetical protein
MQPGFVLFVIADIHDLGEDLILPVFKEAPTYTPYGFVLIGQWRY